jgi:hypothetical protein
MLTCPMENVTATGWPPPKCQRGPPREATRTVLICRCDGFGSNHRGRLGMAA